MPSAQFSELAFFLQDKQVELQDRYKGHLAPETCLVAQFQYRNRGDRLRNVRTYADGGFGGVEAIRVGRDAEVGEGDAVGGMCAAGGGGEGEQDGSVFVGAGGVFLDGCEDGGGFAVGGGDDVVEGLEAPGQGVDADY